jgi:hypothetical protein
MTEMYSMATQENRPAGDDHRRAGRGRLTMTPGRRAALLFGVPVCVALVAATGLSLVADLGTASFPVRYTFPASATRIAVSVGGGQLTLGQAATDRVSLTGTAHYSLVAPHPAATVSGGVASYDYHCPLPFGNCGLDATVTVPPGMTASASTDGGNASVTGTTGTVSLNTGGGELSADNVSGTVTLNTGGGNIQASAVRSAIVTAGSGGGDITIVFTAVPHDVNVSTGGGDITIVVPAGTATYRITASTGGGNVSDNTVPQDPTSPNTISATSGGGDITIREA